MPLIYERVHYNFGMIKNGLKPQCLILLNGCVYLKKRRKKKRVKKIKLKNENY